MKKLFIFTLTSFLLGACSVEEDFQANDSAVIKLTSSINPMTRGTSLDQQSTQIEAGREVGVIINGAKSEHTNVSWSVEEDGTLTNTGNTLYWGNSDVTIYAYHPYNSNWAGTNTNESFSVSTDQSGDGYLDSDLLWVSKTQSKTTEAIALTFTHKLAKINVTLTSDDIDDLSDATISICGTNTDTNFNPITGTLSNVTTTNVQDIKAGVTTSDAYTASAIIIPQTVAANTKLIKVEHNSKVYYYTLPADKEFTTGKSYSFKLKVKEQLVELTSVSDNITDWDSEDEENEGDAEEEDLSWFNPNRYITYVANYENVSGSGNRDYFYYCRSYIDCPSLSSVANKIEYKFQMNNYPSSYTGDKNIYLNNSFPYMNDNGFTFSSDVIYSWDELGVKITDCMVLYISKKDNGLKLNEIEMDYKLSSNYTLTGNYFFTDYYRDYDEGEYKSWSGVPEGSKLYYIKIWDENDNLIYIGGAATALNPQTNQEENCWKSYYEGTYNVEFAYNSTTLTNYQPYGGGVD